MTQKQAVEKTIGEHKYEMYMLSPKPSHKLLFRFLKMVGPSLGPIGDMFFSKLKETKDVSKIMDQEVGAEFFSKAITTLFNDFDENVFDDIISDFSKVTHVDGRPLESIFEIHFMGDLGKMYRWVIWGMSVQWGKSLKDLLGLIPIPKQKVEVKQ